VGVDRVATDRGAVLGGYREPLTVGVESSLNPIDGAMSAITTVSHFTVRRGEGVLEGVCAGVG
jgi:hypothetical protein